MYETDNRFKSIRIQIQNHLFEQKCLPTVWCDVNSLQKPLKKFRFSSFRHWQSIDSKPVNLWELLYSYIIKLIREIKKAFQSFNDKTSFFKRQKYVHVTVRIVTQILYNITLAHPHRKFNINQQTHVNFVIMFTWLKIFVFSGSR